MKRLLVLVVLMMAMATVAMAQTPIRIQLDPQELRGCTVSSNTATNNTQVTVTITPPNGYYVYVCGIDLTSSNNSTSSANTNQSYTSTNLGGWKHVYSLAAAVNNMWVQTFNFNRPIKSTTPGTAVTIVSPAAITSTQFQINVYYYIGQ